MKSVGELFSLSSLIVPSRLVLDRSLDVNYSSKHKNKCNLVADLSLKKDELPIAVIRFSGTARSYLWKK